jgi:peptide/nickel transport system substrate-binding protein
MYYRSDNADFTGMATFLQSWYPAIGVEIELNGLAQAGYFDAVRAGEHHLQFWQETGTDPDILRVYFHSENADGGTNRNRYKNEEMDALLADAAAQTDPAARAELYSEIQMKALDEAIMVYFAEPINIFAFREAEVANIALSWSGAYPFFYDTTMTTP